MYLKKKNKGPDLKKKKNEKEKERRGTENTIYVCVWI